MATLSGKLYLYRTTLQISKLNRIKILCVAAGNLGFAEVEINVTMTMRSITKVKYMNSDCMNIFTPKIKCRSEIGRTSNAIYRTDSKIQTNPTTG